MSILGFIGVLFYIGCLINGMRFGEVKKKRYGYELSYIPIKVEERKLSFIVLYVVGIFFVSLV